MKDFTTFNYAPVVMRYDLVLGLGSSLSASAVNEQGGIPTQEQYENDPDAGRKAIEEADRERQRSSEISVEDVNARKTLSPSSTPSAPLQLSALSR